MTILRLKLMAMLTRVRAVKLITKHLRLPIDNIDA